jgi:signal transduction histidine kinase
VNINPQELTILIIDDFSIDSGEYSGYIRSRSSPQPIPLISCVADTLELCQAYAPDLILLNFGRIKDRGLDFIAALQLQAGDFPFPPIALLSDLSDRSLSTAIQIASRPLGEFCQTLLEGSVDRPLDVTIDRIAVTEELAATTELLKQRDRELDAFAAFASYDLRSSLKGVANLATWLAEDLESYLTPDTRKQFDLLQSRVQRMSQSIADLLEYTQAGKQPITRVRFNVGELLTKIIDSFDIAAGFTIEIASPMPTIRTDRLALQQVFTKLIDNAIKHHDRSDGTVKIVAQSLENGYLFEIIDDGPGIDTQDRERIFELFKSLVPQKDEMSTGMGLAIAKKKIELQGGKIWVDSTPGFGSKFSFTWPEPSLMLPL